MGVAAIDAQPSNKHRESILKIYKACGNERGCAARRAGVRPKGRLPARRRPATLFPSAASQPIVGQWPTWRPDGELGRVITCYVQTSSHD